MRPLLITTALIFLSANAFALGDSDQDQSQTQSQAQGQVQGQKQGQGQSQNSINVNDNTAVSGSSSRSGAVSGSKSGAAAFNKGNAQSVKTSVDASTDVDAEPAYAPNVALTSSNCIGSISGTGGGGGLLSLGFGMTYSVEECYKIESAKVFVSMGMTDEAVAVLKSIDYIGAATRSQQSAQAASVQVSSNSPAVTGSTLCSDVGGYMPSDPQGRQRNCVPDSY